MSGRAVERETVASTRQAPRHGAVSGFSAAEHVLALQRSAGNRAVSAMLEPQQGLLVARCAGGCTCGGKCAEEDLLDERAREDSRLWIARSQTPESRPLQRQAASASAEAIRDVGARQRGLARGFRILQRYSHEDCSEADLKTHIWPADHIARGKVDAAIAAVTASPVSATTEALLAKYFMTRTPDTAKIAKVFRQVKAAFDANKYTYECEEDCKDGKAAYSGRAWDIHLCMNTIRGRTNDCIARTIIHEFSHKYAGAGHGWWFSTAYCYSGCDTAGCPADLSASDALGNAYSYAGFAHEI